MKLSAWMFIGDLIPQKETIFDKFVIAKFIHQNIFNKNNPSDVLLTLKKSGVNGIELVISSNTTELDIQKVDKMLKELNMTIFSIHQPLSTLFNISIQEITNLFEIANKLSAEVIVFHINVIGDQIFDEGYVEALKALEKQYNIKIAIENMPISPLSIFKTYAWKGDKFSSVMEKLSFNITFDTTHLAQTRYDIIDFYKRSKNRIVNIHLSDYKKSFLNTYLMLTKGTHLPLGKGRLPIKNFLQTLKESRYNGLITMEINGSLEELCKSARFIKKWR